MLIDSTVRLVGWNVWGRDGPGEIRQAVIDGSPAACAPGIVTPQEAWTILSRWPLHYGSDRRPAGSGKIEQDREVQVMGPSDK